jgi:hypothetical protein
MINMLEHKRAVKYGHSSKMSVYFESNNKQKQKNMPFADSQLEEFLYIQDYPLAYTSHYQGQQNLSSLEIPVSENDQSLIQADIEVEDIIV